MSFDNRLCNAYQTAGKSGEYLDKLSKELEASTTADSLTSLEEKFPRGGAFGLLSNNPELLPKCKLKLDPSVLHTVELCCDGGVCLSVGQLKF